MFTNRYGYVHNPQTINRAIKRIYTACNEREKIQAKKEHRQPVLIPHFSAHNLRHTFCTRLCENENDLKIIQEIMGHSDITTTMNIYNEATKERKQESFAMLFFKLLLLGIGYFSFLIGSGCLVSGKKSSCKREKFDT